MKFQFQMEISFKIFKNYSVLNLKLLTSNSFPVLSKQFTKQVNKNIITKLVECMSCNFMLSFLKLREINFHF